MIVGKNPFAILLPDVIIDDAASDLKKDNLAAMIKLFEETGTSQIMVEKVPHNEVSSYGIVNLNGVEPKPGQDVQIKSIIEKPSIDEAPSDYAVVGRYVLSSEIWPLFKRTPLGAGGEFQLTDTIELLMHLEDIHAYPIIGHSHDCGNKEGYVKTFIDYSLRHPSLGKAITEYVKSLKL